jgi:hypothetical protein
VYPYRIRLAGPWEYQLLERAGGGELPPPGRMTMPCHWQDGGLDDFAGRVRFVRRFGRPRRLDPHERVWLTFAGIGGSAAVDLNGTPLGGRDRPGPFEFDVTALLRERNELRVDVESSGPDAGLWGLVALEVRGPAFLRGVEVRPAEDGTGRLRVKGEVVGDAGRPLELYVLADGATALYTNVEAGPEGRPFDVVTEERPGAGGPVRVRVDLVEGGVTWYAVESAPD